MALLISPGPTDAGLSWDATTHGVTLEGMNDVLNSIKLVMVDQARENLSKTEGIQEAVTEGWSGVDRDMWLQNFNSLRREIDESLEFYYNQIEALFQKIFTDWEEFQASNVTQG